MDVSTCCTGLLFGLGLACTRSCCHIGGLVGGIFGVVAVIIVSAWGIPPLGKEIHSILEDMVSTGYSKVAKVWGIASKEGG